MAKHKAELGLLEYRYSDVERVLNRLIERLLTFHKLKKAKKVEKYSKCPSTRRKVSEPEKLNFGVSARLVLMTLEFREIFSTSGRREEEEPRAHVDERTRRRAGPCKACTPYPETVCHRYERQHDEKGYS